MSWFQIGSGYYGLSVASVKLTDDDRKVAAKAFDSAFSIPSQNIRVDHEPAKAHTVKANKGRSEQQSPLARKL